MRILGLDPGKENRVAMRSAGDYCPGFTGNNRTGLEKDIALIGDICRSGVELIVMGLPRNKDGTEGEKAKAARRLARTARESG